MRNLVFLNWSNVEFRDPFWWALAAIYAVLLCVACYYRKSVRVQVGLVGLEGMAWLSQSLMLTVHTRCGNIYFAVVEQIRRSAVSLFSVETIL